MLTGILIGFGIYAVYAFILIGFFGDDDWAVRAVGGPLYWLATGFCFVVVKAKQKIKKLRHPERYNYTWVTDD